MKKFLLTLGVACLALPSFAATRILYQQNFESCSVPEDAGWSVAGGSIAIASNDFGKYLEIALGSSNGRSAVTTWGQDIYMENGQSILEDGIYNVEFDFCMVTASTNQYNGCITVFTNHEPVTSQPYRNPWSPAGYWQNYVFDMSQVANEANQFVINGGTIATEADGTTSYAIDYTDPKTIVAGTYYKVLLTVNTVSREVDYSVVEAANLEPIQEGTITVPETDVNGGSISMYAEGLFIMLARYQTTYWIDNIKISTETSADYANAPTISLTRLGQTADEELDLNMRAYTISFGEEETLHVIGTDGAETVVEAYECEELGQYVYETTTSGTLTAYTTYNSAKSEEVSVEVDCTPVVLPEVTATISSVSEGFAKTYTLSVSNADVPMRPTIFINYEFKGVNGETQSGTDLASGAKVSVSEEGTLTLTSAAYGYQSNTVNVQNDVEFETKKVYDFARMSKEELQAAGFASWTVLNSETTSGFNNWTARKRLYYEVEGSEYVNDDGETVRVIAYPFGFISADNTTNVIEYCDTDGNEDGSGYFDGLSVFAGQRVSAMYRIGIYNPDTSGGNYKNIVVKDLDQSDFVVVNYINSYGSNSNHPVVATDEEYFKLLAGEDTVYSVAESGVLNEETNLYDVTHALYRIDTACTKISVFKLAGSQSGVQGVETEVEGDNWFYSIDGVRMAQPTRPGIYIRNGKKIIVK